MQNGSHSNTGGLASTPVLRASGGLAALADDVSAQDGGGHGFTLVRSDAAIRGRSDQRSGSVSDRLLDSGGVGHDLPDTAKEVGVDGMAGSGARDSVSRLRDGPSSLSYASSADSRDHEAHCWGQQDPSLIYIEARAGAVQSHERWEGNRGAGGLGDRVQRHQTGDGRDPRLDSLAPPRSFFAPHEAARQRKHGPYRRYKPRKRGRDARPSPRSFVPPGSRRSGTRSSRRPAVASTTAPCPFQHSRGGKATLPCWEDARSSLGRGPPHSARR
jgi:hypothetical protein